FLPAWLHSHWHGWRKQSPCGLAIARGDLTPAITFFKLRVRIKFKHVAQLRIRNSDSIYTCDELSAGQLNSCSFGDVNQICLVFHTLRIGSTERIAEDGVIGKQL